MHLHWDLRSVSVFACVCIITFSHVVCLMTTYSEFLLHVFLGYLKLYAPTVGAGLFL